MGNLLIFAWNTAFRSRGGGGHLYFRLDIIRVKGLSKHTLNTYFSGMKIDPKYAFCVFLNLSVISIPKFVNMTKNIPFFPILHVFAPLNDVRAYIASSWKTTLITWFFLRGWYPTSDTSGPPPPGFRFMQTATGRWSLFSFRIGQLLHKYPTHQEIILKTWNY